MVAASLGAQGACTEKVRMVADSTYSREWYEVHNGTKAGPITTWKQQATRTFDSTKYTSTTVSPALMSSERDHLHEYPLLE